MFSCQEDDNYVPLEDDNPILESPVNFDINLIGYCEKIIIFSGYLNHGIYYKTIEQARKLDKEIIR
jgi:hypothetical protein